jgi:hypothetical protein
MEKSNMNVSELARKIASTLPKFTKAYKYDLVYREYDDMVELIGLVDDPNYDMRDFQNREMLFPKRWVTLETLDPAMEVKV